jgi:hypothetical protein
VSGDRAIRRLTAAVVLAVAAFAAIVSYSHIYDLGRAHGQAGTAARLLPLSVDGLILAASLVLLHEARNGRSAPALARWMLGLGVAATVAANVAYGLPYGPLGAVVSAWPAVAFIGAAELGIGLARRARGASAGTASPEPAGAVPSDLAEAAKASMRATTAAGNPLSANQLQERFSLTRGAATRLRRDVLAEANGHAPAAAGKDTP